MEEEINSNIPNDPKPELTENQKEFVKNLRKPDPYSFSDARIGLPGMNVVRDLQNGNEEDKVQANKLLKRYTLSNIIGIIVGAGAGIIAPLLSKVKKNPVTTLLATDKIKEKVNGVLNEKEDNPEEPKIDTTLNQDSEPEPEIEDEGGNETSEQQKSSIQPDPTLEIESEKAEVNRENSESKSKGLDKLNLDSLMRRTKEILGDAGFTNETQVSSVRSGTLVDSDLDIVEDNKKPPEPPLGGKILTPFEVEVINLQNRALSQLKSIDKNSVIIGKSIIDLSNSIKDRDTLTNLLGTYKSLNSKMDLNNEINLKDLELERVKIKSDVSSTKKLDNNLKASLSKSKSANSDSMIEKKEINRKKIRRLIESKRYSKKYGRNFNLDKAVLGAAGFALAVNAVADLFKKGKESQEEEMKNLSKDISNTQQYYEGNPQSERPMNSSTQEYVRPEIFNEATPESSMILTSIDKLTKSGVPKRKIKKVLIDQAKLEGVKGKKLMEYKSEINRLYHLNQRFIKGDISNEYFINHSQLKRFDLTETLSKLNKSNIKSVNNQSQVKSLVSYRKELLESEMTKSGIIDQSERAAILAQAHHETGGFKFMEELGSKGKEAGSQYEGRSNLGNKNKGDGVRYKGRGPFMLTGRRNYEYYGNKIGVDLVSNPELAADPVIGSQIAIAYWLDRGMGVALKTKGFEENTRILNGGLNGIEERKKLYAFYLNTNSNTNAITRSPQLTNNFESVIDNSTEIPNKNFNHNFFNKFNVTESTPRNVVKVEPQLISSPLPKFEVEETPMEKEKVMEKVDSPIIINPQTSRGGDYIDKRQIITNYNIASNSSKQAEIAN